MERPQAWHINPNRMAAPPSMVFYTAQHMYPPAF
jgi:hypothetical protein